MLDILDRKIRQMHESLGALRNVEISNLKQEHAQTEIGFYRSIDFSQGKTTAGLANIATLLVANIACLKDHLKAWCKMKNIAFEGDHLINSDISVAIVHDLWNIDKHTDQYSNKRSGHIPKIVNLRQTLNLSAGTQAGGFAIFSMDPMTGKTNVQSSGGGSVGLVISGAVLDENGNRLGDFLEICERAVQAWEQTMIKSGIPMPVK